MCAKCARSLHFDCSFTKVCDPIPSLHLFSPLVAFVYLFIKFLTLAGKEMVRNLRRLLLAGKEIERNLRCLLLAGKEIGRNPR